MANEITMPKLSDTMEEGKILRWLKQVGDTVKAGEVIAEVETDKADMEVEASDAGRLSEIRVAEGESAAVGDVIAVLDGAGRKGEAEGERAGGGRTEGERREEAEERPQVAAKPGEALRASPLARRIADERGIDLHEVRGTGPSGRIVRRDVESSGEARREVRAQKAAPAPSGAAVGKPLETGRIELSKMRRTIASRMSEAKREIPHFYLTAEIDMGEAVRMVASLKARLEQRVTVTHLLIKGAALALAEHPRVNGRWADGSVDIGPEINIGIAVALEDGLIVPVVRGCERLSLLQLAAEADGLVARAREGRPGGDDLKGGTFSISNIGMLDVDELCAVINPPQAAILAVGAVKDRPVVRDGQIVAAKTMRVTLSCDHRQLNGIEAGRFLETLKSILENPVSLVID